MKTGKLEYIEPVSNINAFIFVIINKLTAPDNFRIVYCFDTLTACS